MVAGAMTHKAIHRTRRKAHSDAARVNRVPTWAVQNEIRAYADCKEPCAKAAEVQTCARWRGVARMKATATRGANATGIHEM